MRTKVKEIKKDGMTVATVYEEPNERGMAYTLDVNLENVPVSDFRKLIEAILGRAWGALHERERVHQDLPKLE